MFELWEDNAGGLHMYRLDHETGTADWGETYPADRADAPYEAAGCWAAWVCDGYYPLDYDAGIADPDADRRETIDLGATLIASTSWLGLHLLGVDPDMCGRAGLDFAQELGVCKMCPACGSIITGTYIASAGAIRYPLGCPWCGADLD